VEPFPQASGAIDAGGRGRIHSESGWRPEANMAEGIGRTRDYYGRNPGLRCGAPAGLPARDAHGAAALNPAVAW
jgi:hypothetical protein